MKKILVTFTLVSLVLGLNNLAYSKKHHKRQSQPGLIKSTGRVAGNVVKDTGTVVDNAAKGTERVLRDL